MGFICDACFEILDTVMALVKLVRRLQVCSSTYRQWLSPQSAFLKYNMLYSRPEARRSYPWTTAASYSAGNFSESGWFSSSLLPPDRTPFHASCQ